MRRLIIRLLVGLLILLLGLDGLLRLFDPLGVVRHDNDIDALYRHVAPDAERQYVMLPGIYQFSNWQATISSDGSRYVPDTDTNAACRIALIGDSMTFGYGISDAETWANRLARDFPSVDILNEGVSAYNIQNAWATLQQVSASGYLYLMISDDAEPPFAFQAVVSGAGWSALYQYVYWFEYFRTPGPRLYSHLDTFYTTLDKFIERADAVVVAFPDPLTDRALAHNPNIQVIQHWTHTNSRADPHPNADGAREIEAEIKPIFAALVQKVCGG